MTKDKKQCGNQEIFDCDKYENCKPRGLAREIYIYYWHCLIWTRLRPSMKLLNGL